jgi:23S rRNA (uracil1939-C5)-methyltransferase
VNARRPTIPDSGKIVRLTIEGLGGLGDGIGRREGVPVYVPLTAPGDVADVLIGSPRGDGVAGRLMTLVEPGADRRVPPCPHYGECGGCAVQHLAPEAYARWKGGLVGDALARQGVTAKIDPMLSPAPDDPAALRRRATFAAEAREGAVATGFNARATRRIVSIANCLLLTERLNRLLPALPELMGAFLAAGERGQAAATDVDGALDVLAVAAREPGARARARIADLATRHGVARVSWRDTDSGAPPETVVQRAPCRIVLGGAEVEFPPGGFLQPSSWGEMTLQRLVVEGMGRARRVADLFAGIGTFSLPLALDSDNARRKVAAFEREPGLAEALRRGANRAGLSGRLSITGRDLDRRPLLADELGDFDAVVLDPPRTGAKAQCQILARVRGLRRLVMVSCNPATFARDARILADGGWTLERATPVDQFLYSAHLELVAIFSRLN